MVEAVGDVLFAARQQLVPALPGSGGAPPLFAVARTPATFGPSSGARPWRSRTQRTPGRNPPMAKLTLYHAAPSRSSIVHWMLEEVGEPYEVHLLNLQRGDTRAADYLAVNPMGKVPAIRHGDVVVTETAAICAYLADEFPKAGLNVPV